MRPSGNSSARRTAEESSSDSKPTTMEAAEREHILATLRATNWTISGPHGAAARLGMKRTTLQSRMKKLGISRPCPSPEQLTN